MSGFTPQRNMFNADPDLLRARGFMRDRIFGMLLHRQTQTIDETQRTKFKYISKRLEEGLFKAASTKEDYMNMDTLEARLSYLIKGRLGNNHNQRHQQLASQMIPTPGFNNNSNQTNSRNNMSHEQRVQEDLCQRIAGLSFTESQEGHT